MSQVKLSDLFTPDQIATLRRRWDRAVGAILGGDDPGPDAPWAEQFFALHYIRPGQYDLPEVARLAENGCLLYCGVLLGESVTPDVQASVHLAALDAQPEGEDAAMRAAAERLHSIAVAGGWDDELPDFDADGRLILDDDDA